MKELTDRERSEIQEAEEARSVIMNYYMCYVIVAPLFLVVQ